MSITVITNNHARPVVYGYELTTAERAEFDYLSDDELETRSFVRYRGQVLDLGDGFEIRIPEGTPGRWDGFQSDSFFSGVLVRYSSDYEYVVMGTLIA